MPQVVDKYKIVGSIARALLRELVATGALKVVEQHSKQGLYTPAVVAAEKTAAVPEKEAGKGKAQAKKPAKEAKEAKWLSPIVISWLHNYYLTISIPYN